MYSIFILCLILQCSKFAYGNPSFPDYMDINADDSESSAEELTTLRFETITEANPPILTSTAAILKETSLSLTPFLMKLVSIEPRDIPVEHETEAYIANESIQAEPIEITIKKPVSKSIKPRLLESKPEEIFAKSEYRDDETLEVSFDEDTTPVTEIDAEVNETNINFAEDETTILPPTSKKPKKIEIYKTRPNELLRHYVEDSHLRSPIAALIDKKSNPLMKAKKLWKAALRPNSLLDIMVVSYDSEGKQRSFSQRNEPNKFLST